jgi:hypothetical protein
MEKGASRNTPVAGTLSPFATVTLMLVQGMKQRPQRAVAGADTKLWVELESRRAVTVMAPRRTTTCMVSWERTPAMAIREMQG